MASIAFIFGSTFGAFGGLLGWLVFGMSGSGALTLYLGLGVGLPVLSIALSLLAGLLRSNAPEDGAQSQGTLTA